MTLLAASDTGLAELDQREREDCLLDDTHGRRWLVEM